MSSFVKTTIAKMFESRMAKVGETIKGDLASIHKRFCGPPDEDGNISKMEWLKDHGFRTGLTSVQLVALIWAQEPLLKSHPGKHVHKHMSSMRAVILAEYEQGRKISIMLADPSTPPEEAKEQAEANRLALYSFMSDVQKKGARQWIAFYAKKHGLNIKA